MFVLTNPQYTMPVCLRKPLQKYFRRQKLASFIMRRSVVCLRMPATKRFAADLVKPK